MKLFIATISLALSVMTNAEEAKSIKYRPSGSQITITDLGLLPGGTVSSGLAINNQPIIVGLATDSTFALQRPLWDANTGAIVGMADNMNPASTAIPEHIAESGEMAGSEVYGDNVYQGVYWNSAGQAFALPPMAGVDPFYGGLHTKAHGINNLGQLVGTGKEAEPNFYTHAVLWPNKDTEAIDLGFLGQGTPLNYSVAYGVNDLSHVVGNGTVGSQVHAFLWRNGQMIDLGASNGLQHSEAYAISNTGFIAGKSILNAVIWEYDVADPDSTPTFRQLPIPSGFFSATPTAVSDSGDVVGYAGSPNIDAHAILWRDGIAIDLGVWPGGHFSVANGINNLGQIVGTGTVAGDNLDHALMWMVAAPPINISGTISYCSNPVPGPVPNVTLTLTGTMSGSTLSGGSGNYTFSSLPSGGNYIVTPTKAGLLPASAGINTVDVIAIQRHFLALGTPLSGCRLTAADVDLNASVNTVDVIAVQRFFLGLSTGIAQTGKYRFTPVNRSYLGLVSNQSGQNYDTLIFGDVAPTFADRLGGPSQDAAGDATMSPGDVPATVAALFLPNVAVDAFVANFVLQVTTTAIDAKNNVVGFQGDLTFDERVVTFQSPPVQKAGLTAGNWNVSGNVLPGAGPIRTLRISAYSNDFTPLSGEGTLFELRMSKVSQAAQSTPLLWAAPPNQFIFIDADLNTQKPGNAASGSLTPSAKRK